MAKRSLKAVVGSSRATPAPAPPQETQLSPRYRSAQTRAATRQIGGHFKAEAAHTLKIIAAEEDRDVQELLGEALNMLFSKYGKRLRLEVTSRRRKGAGQ